MTSTEHVDYTNLAAGSVIDVETKTRHYRIECHGGNEIRISGHPEYCPEPVPAQLHGSIITRGSHLRFMLTDRRPVTTTRVVRLCVDRPKPPSSSIH